MSIAARPRLVASTLAVLGVVLAAVVAVGLGRLLSASPGAPPGPGPSAVLHATPMPPIHTTRLEHGARHRPLVHPRRAKRHVTRRGGRASRAGLRQAPPPAQVVPVIVPAPTPPSRVFLQDPAAPTPTATPSGPAAGDSPDAAGPSRGIPDATPAPTATPGSTPAPLPGDD
jgi:hypothetical protein